MALIKAIHSPKNTQASWVRWASSMVILLTFSLAFYQQHSNGSVQETLVISLIGLALGSKVAQKAIETRNKNKENEDEIE
ncbi:hypothetical protein HYO65_gp186 [Tenacibaculum phage PTm1]|nr:hypothetical protein HYO65_gp186 [Tenacibaculum phage PTm1]BBI90578.1 hypothetical protein [Tenacibaculum phage PTm1]